MKSVFDIRRDNLRKLMEQWGGSFPKERADWKHWAILALLVALLVMDVAQLLLR